MSTTSSGDGRTGSTATGHEDVYALLDDFGFDDGGSIGGGAAAAAAAATPPAPRPPPNPEYDASLRRLRDSTASLAQTLDQTYSIRSKTSAVVKEVSASLANASTAVAGGIDQIGSGLGIDQPRTTVVAGTQTPLRLSSELGAAVRQSEELTRPAREALAPHMVNLLGALGGAVKDGARRLDERRGIVRGAVDILASGAEFVIKAHAEGVEDGEDVEDGEYGEYGEYGENDEMAMAVP